MQETEKIKADNQISKNENLVQVWFFNQSHFKTNRKAVNLSQGRDSFPSPRGLCPPTHCTRHWVVWGCCHPTAWPGPGTGHRAGHSRLAVPLLPHDSPGASSCCPGATGPAVQLPPEPHEVLWGSHELGLVPWASGAETCALACAPACTSVLFCMTLRSCVHVGDGVCSWGTQLGQLQVPHCSQLGRSCQERLLLFWP